MRRAIVSGVVRENYRRIVSMIAILPITASIGFVMMPTTVYAAPPAASSSCPGSFLGLEPWWKYLPASDFGDPTHKCNITDFHVGFGFGGDTNGSDIPLVFLAVVDDLLRIAGLVAVGFIIYAAFGFITSQGNAEQAAKARGTAINALIGLIFAIVATILVTFIGNSLG